jgi:hypothetical protein
LNAEALSKYAGAYEFVAGRQVTVAAGDGFLTFQEGANAAKRELVPQSETLFVFRAGGDDVEFLKDAGGAVTKFVAHGGGKDQIAIRKSDMTTGGKR